MSKWFRWYEGTSEDGKFRVTARNAGVTVATVMGVWAVLLEDASNDEHRGSAVRGCDFYSAILDVPEDEMQRILQCMDDVGLISASAEEISITKWKQRQFETDTSDGTNAERQKRFRDKRKTNANVTERNGSVTAMKRPDTDTDTDKKDTCAVAKATRPKREYSKEFEEAWRAYPGRDGGNPKPPAAKRFLSAVKAGTDPQIIIDAAKRFAIAENRNVGTAFIPQMVKWLKDERWLDYDGTIVPMKPNLRGHFV